MLPRDAADLVTRVARAKVGNGQNSVRPSAEFISAHAQTSLKPPRLDDAHCAVLYQARSAVAVGPPVGTPPPSSRLVLSSWKEIASYLKVDVRTAQRWDKKRPLPLHRFVTGERSHPYAYADELDHWLAALDVARHIPDAAADGLDAPAGVDSTPGRIDAAANRHAAGNGEQAGTETSTSGQRTRVRWAWGSLGLVVVIAASLGIVAMRRPGVPVTAKLDGVRLTVLDAAGRTCFTRDIPEFIDGEGTGNPATQDDWIIEDVDGDRTPEVLVNVPATVHGNTTGRLVRFDHLGRQTWEFRYGKDRSWEGREFSPKYRGRLIGSITARGTRYVIGVAWHSRWFPTQVVLLDARTGVLIDEYWHPGAVYEALPIDMDGDGEQELLLGGLSNPGLGLGHAGLAALAVPFSKAPAKSGGMAAFSGGRELAYVAVPRSDVCTAEGVHPFVTLLAADGDHQVLMRTLCGDVSFHYTFDRTLHLVDTQFTDNLPAHHMQLERRGLLSHALDEEERACLRQVAHFPTVVNGNAPELFARWSRCE